MDHIWWASSRLNKTKYFRLRLSDDVGTERPETDLRLTWDWPETDLRLPWDFPETALRLPWDWPGTDLRLTWDWPETDLRLTWDWPETDLRLTWDRTMRERWRFSALDKLVPDGQTDRQTDWHPELLTEPKRQQDSKWGHSWTIHYFTYPSPPCNVLCLGKKLSRVFSRVTEALDWITESIGDGQCYHWPINVELNGLMDIKSTYLLLLRCQFSWVKTFNLLLNHLLRIWAHAENWLTSRIIDCFYSYHYYKNVKSNWTGFPFFDKNSKDQDISRFSFLI